MNKKISSVFLFLCFLALVNPLESQNKKFWVMFKNKTGTPYTITNANDFLTPRAVNRRVNYNIPVDEKDLPCTPSYITQVKNVANVTVLYASKWLNGVVVSIPPANITTAMNAINALPFVSGSGSVNKHKIARSFNATAVP